MFYTQSDNCIPINLPIFLTPKFYLLLNWKSLELAYQVKGLFRHTSCLTPRIMTGTLCKQSSDFLLLLLLFRIRNMLF